MTRLRNVLQFTVRLNLKLNKDKCVFVDAKPLLVISSQKISAVVHMPRPQCNKYMQDSMKRSNFLENLSFLTKLLICG